MKGIAKWVGGLLAAVLSGVLVYWLTTGLDTDNTDNAGNTTTPSAGPTQPTDRPTDPQKKKLSFVERLQGDWRLGSWSEAGGPVTLYIDVSAGTLRVTDRGQVDWQLDIDERAEDNRPQPKIKCGGQTTLNGRIEGVPGGGRNAQIDWTSDLRSIDDMIQLALCGWVTTGARAPYEVTLAGPDTEPATAMEMTNQSGTFRWTRG